MPDAHPALTAFRDIVAVTTAWKTICADDPLDLPSTAEAKAFIHLFGNRTPAVPAMILQIGRQGSRKVAERTWYEEGEIDVQIRLPDDASKNHDQMLAEISDTLFELRSEIRDEAQKGSLDIDAEQFERPRKTGESEATQYWIVRGTVEFPSQ